MAALAGRVGAEPAARVDDRGRFGLQVGGPNYAEMMLRYRLVGPLHVEGGFMIVPGPLMASAGLVLAQPVAGRLEVYAALGASGIAWFSTDSCPEGSRGCVDADAALFATARAGLSIPAGRGAITIDAGVWRGTARDYGSPDVHGERHFTVPMVGVGYWWGP